WSFPSAGGVMPPQNAAAKIGAPNVGWGPVTIDTRVYKGQYAVRADGFFSDQSIYSSAYVIQQVDGDAAPADEQSVVLIWSGGYPKSENPLKISCAGTYTGSPNAQLSGEIYATPLAGGVRTKGTLKMNADAKTWISDPVVTVPAGSTVGTVTYSVIAY